MHEWALADAVVTSVTEALGGRPPGALRGVVIVVGELQAVDMEVFRFGLESIMEQSGLDPKAASVKIQPAELACRACGKRWSLEDPAVDAEQREAIHFLPEAAHAFLRCPSCGSVDFSVEKGRGVHIEAVELEDEAP